MTDVQQRLSAHQVLQHPWIQQVVYLRDVGGEGRGRGGGVLGGREEEKSREAGEEGNYL